MGFQLIQFHIASALKKNQFKIINVSKLIKSVIHLSFSNNLTSNQ